MLVTTARQLPNALRRRHLMTALMGLYEDNHRLLAALAPDIWRFQGRHVSRMNDGMDLHLDVIEQAPYTTIFRLTHFFDEPGNGKVADPAMQVRVYHDAGLTEAVSCRHRPQFHFSHYALPQVRLPLGEWKHELNIFLGKWLSYCLEQGHRFDFNSN